MKIAFNSMNNDEQNLVKTALMMFMPDDLLIRKKKGEVVNIEIVPAQGISVGILIEIGFMPLDDFLSDYQPVASRPRKEQNASRTKF